MPTHLFTSKALKTPSREVHLCLYEYGSERIDIFDGSVEKTDRTMYGSVEMCVRSDFNWGKFIDYLHANKEKIVRFREVSMKNAQIRTRNNAE